MAPGVSPGNARASTVRVTSGPGRWAFSGGRPGDLGQEVPALSQSPVGAGQPWLSSTEASVRFCSVLPPRPALIRIVPALTVPPLVPSAFLPAPDTRAFPSRPSFTERRDSREPGWKSEPPRPTPAAPSTVGPLGLCVSSSCSSGVGAESAVGWGFSREAVCVCEQPEPRFWSCAASCVCDTLVGLLSARDTWGGSAGLELCVSGLCSVCRLRCFLLLGLVSVSRVCRPRAARPPVGGCSATVTDAAVTSFRLPCSHARARVLSARSWEAPSRVLAGRGAVTAGFRVLLALRVVHAASRPAVPRGPAVPVFAARCASQGRLSGGTPPVWMGRLETHFGEAPSRCTALPVFLFLAFFFLIGKNSLCILHPSLLSSICLQMSSASFSL